MDPTALALRAASSASATMGRAAMRDNALKAAARLLLFDLEAIDENLARALQENNKRYLERERLRSSRWPELQAEFARAFKHSQNQAWEELNGLFETERFLDSKRVDELGEDRPLDVREQGWVWFASSTHIPLRREMRTLSTTRSWRRWLSTPMEVTKQNLEVTPPPVPPAVLQFVEDHPSAEPQDDHWDITTMAFTVRFALKFFPALSGAGDAS